MGNLLVGYHPSTLILKDDKNHYHDHRLRHRKPHMTGKDELVGLRNIIYNWKTSKNEFLFFSYRAVCGAFLGLGYAFLMYPMMKSSPYMARKMLMSYNKTDIFPVDSLKFMLGKIAPYYTFAGFVSGFGASFLSEAYDRAFCSNIITKYTFLGALDGYLFAIFFGSVGSWTNGTLAGVVFSLCLLGYQSLKPSTTQGEFGEASVYMNHVTSEEKKKFEKQEARLSLNYNEI